MHFQIQNFFAIGMIIGAVTALPSPDIKTPETVKGLVLIHSEPTNSTVDGKLETGVLSFYAKDPNSPTVPIASTPNDNPLSKRVCGGNNVKCGSAHKARAHVCATLINSLSRTSSNVPQSPQSICQDVQDSDGWKKCCVSWADPVPWGTAQRFQLTNAAWKVYDTCMGTIQTVSGRTRDTLIGDTCTAQCLSDRPDGCAW